PHTPPPFPYTTLFRSRYTTRRLNAHTDSGANTTRKASAQTTDHSSGSATGPPSISPRTASEMMLTGLTFTNASSHPGNVAAGTNTLLTIVSGNIAVKPKICTRSGSLAVMPTSTDTHEKHSAKPSS